MFTFNEKNASEKPLTQESDSKPLSEFKERAEKVMPIEVVQIKENPDLNPAREMGCLNLDFFSGGEDQFGGFNLKKNFEVNGKAIKLRLKLDGSPQIAGYEPSIDTYTMGRGAIEDYNTDKEIFYYDVNHEAAHDEFLNLGLNEQRALIDLMLQNKTLNESLRKFATTLYTDKLISKDRHDQSVGDKYLEAHEIIASKTLVYVSDGNRKGIKDKRSMEIVLDGKKRDLLIGALATEFISFLSSCERGWESFEKVATSYRSKRDGDDPRFDVIREAYERIEKDPALKKELDRYSLFKNNNSEFLERIAEETLRLERWLYSC